MDKKARRRLKWAEWVGLQLGVVPDPQNEFERFMSRVDVNAWGDGCWIWRNSANCKTAPSYGWRGTVITAPRASYLLFVNSYIPPGHVICHTCDNPRCVNPGHLWAGTQSENIKDMYAKGRGGCQKAELPYPQSS